VELEQETRTRDTHNAWLLFNHCWGVRYFQARHEIQGFLRRHQKSCNHFPIGPFGLSKVNVHPCEAVGTVFCSIINEVVASVQMLVVGENEAFV
jgi:hypothetical protein